MEYGILEYQYEYGKESKYVMVYPFGKADQIELENNRIMLYKYENNRVLKGVFDDPLLGTHDPIYTQFKICVSMPYYFPLIPNFNRDDVKTSLHNQEKWHIPYIMVGQLKDGKEGLLIDDAYDKDGNPLKIDCKYKRIDLIAEFGDNKVFQTTDFDNQKSVTVVCKKQDYYEFKSTPFKYNSILYNHGLNKGKIRCSKENVDGYKHDIYNCSLYPIIFGADIVCYFCELKMHEVIKKTDENNKRIMFIDNNKNILFDEQGKNIGVVYDRLLKTFFVNNNGVLQVRYPNGSRYDDTQTDIQGDYLNFNFIVPTNLIKYRRKSDTGDSMYGLYMFEHGYSDNVSVKSVLNDEYESIDVVANGTRAIVSKMINSKKPVIKYGVMEIMKNSQEENVCIPIDYDEIILDKGEDDNEIFTAITIKGNVIQKDIYDVDGLLIEHKIEKNNQDKTLLKRMKKQKNAKK